jgi:hypothetical protein
MTKADLNTTPIPSRRAVLAAGPAVAVAALAGGTAANAVVIGLAKAGEVDPIYAAIEDHKAACAAARQMGDLLGELSPSDAQYKSVDAQHSTAFQQEKRTVAALLSCPPTTIAGAIAVLTHVGQAEWMFGDNSDETILTGAHESDIEEAKAFPAHLAAALCNIIERGRA